MADENYTYRARLNGRPYCEGCADDELAKIHDAMGRQKRPAKMADVFTWNFGRAPTCDVYCSVCSEHIETAPDAQ